MTEDRGKIAQLLGLAAMAGAILAPPEVFGSGRMILILGSTFALLILSLDGKISSRFLWIGVGGTLFLVWHSFWISIDVYRSLEFSEILWSYYCLFGRLLLHVRRIQSSNGGNSGTPVGNRVWLWDLRVHVGQHQLRPLDFGRHGRNCSNTDPG